MTLRGGSLVVWFHRGTSKVQPYKNFLSSYSSVCSLDQEEKKEGPNPAAPSPAPAPAPSPAPSPAPAPAPAPTIVD